MEYIDIHPTALVEIRSLGYTNRVEAQRPGIADADRPRVGAFAKLLDEIRADPSALDALAFAYGELGLEERRHLIRAVVQDARNPIHALGALLAVESDAIVAGDLSDLLRRHGHKESFATFEARPDGGEVCFCQPRFGFAIELMRISWNNNHIENIEVESRVEMNSIAPNQRVPVDAAVEAVAALLWRHIREGHGLPEGVERFAGFFSVF